MSCLAVFENVAVIVIFAINAEIDTIAKVASVAEFAILTVVCHPFTSLLKALKFGIAFQSFGNVAFGVRVRSIRVLGCLPPIPCDRRRIWCKVAF